MERSKLLDIIPQEELMVKLNYGSVELDPTFLCFEHVYVPVSKIVPKHFTIVDLGCYQAAQAYLFAKHKAYIGVDMYDKVYDGKGYLPPLRFRPRNSRHYVMSIEEFFEKVVDKLKLDLDETYFIMSYVPSFHDKPYWLRGKAKNFLWVYCENVHAEGIFVEEIEEAVMEKRRNVLKEML